MPRRTRPKTKPAQRANVTAKNVAPAIKRNDISRQSEIVDGFEEDDQSSSIILATPYEMTSVAAFVDNSNILPQCIEAMKTNTTSNGYRVVPIDDNEEMDNAEKEILESYIKSPNTEETMVAMNEKMVEDYERYGFAFIEVIRDARKRPSLLKHAKAFNTRLVRRSGKAVPVTVQINRGGARSTVTEYRKFRKYVQISGATKRYFKEFGDPRPMDYMSGKYATKENPIAKGKLATELMHHRQYSEDSYGLPRWISQLPAILGSRESEEGNLRYFEDNTVPPMIMSVAGGRLTKQSFQDLSQILQAKGLGKDRQNQILLIEAIPETTGLDEKGTVSIQIDKLTDARQSDQLFKDYDELNMEKVRSSFRLPPVIIGLSQDVTFATANVSAYLAETQVFVPERQTHDEFMNKGFVNHPAGLGLKTVKVESKGPSVTNPDQIVKTMTAVNVMGGVTPRSSIAITNETMQLSLPDYPERDAEGWEDWMDKPIALGLKEAAPAQQTGEGDTDKEVEGNKDDAVQDTEKDGKTGVETQAVENGQQ